MGALRLSARWVLPMDGPPISGGALLAGDDGRIVAVGPEASVPRPPLAVAHDLGNAALLPGLVNTHAHLELTALRGLVRERPFPLWVRTVRHLKAGLTPAHYAASARWGVLESFAAGITTTGDTGSTLAPARAMHELGARGVAFHEVFGPDPGQAGESLALLRTALEELRASRSDRVAIGVSPHAPYTVSEPLLRAVAGLARERRLPLAMHVAESPEEHRFVLDGAGPFAEMHAKRGIAVVARGTSPVRWALGAGLAGLRPLLIHCVTAGDDDWAAAAAAGAAVAHCPWSNAMLGNGRADLAAIRRHHIRHGLGTDSVAAGGGLDLFAEARHAALGVEGGLSPREMLGLITMDAAGALGVAGAGSLAPGHWADCTAVRVTRAGFGAAGTDIETALAWSAQAGDVTATWVAGRKVFERGEWPGVDPAAARRALGEATATALAARAAAPVS